MATVFCHCSANDTSVHKNIQANKKACRIKRMSKECVTTKEGILFLSLSHRLLPLDGSQLACCGGYTGRRGCSGKTEGITVMTSRCTHMHKYIHIQIQMHKINDTQ